MAKRLRYLLQLFLIPAGFLQAQNIAGVWEGYMDTEFLQVNIQQKGTVICGFTYDYILKNPANHCRAAFEGQYDDESKLWILTGTSFIENSGSHTFMRLRLWREPGDPMNSLRANVTSKGFLGSLFGGKFTDLILTMVATKTDLQPFMEPCFPIVKKEKKIKKGKPLPDLNTADTIIALPEKPVSPAVPSVSDTSQLAELVKVRKQTEQSRIIVATDQLTLKLYDNGVVDNDTISVFYNGKLLVSHQRLSEKPIELNILLDKTKLIHEITLYAENLGGIPPNTALVVVTAGKQRYELRSKASLEENAVLVFEYQPPE